MTLNASFVIPWSNFYTAEMKEFRGVLLTVIPISFSFGLWWSLQALEGRPPAEEDQIRLLVYGQRFPQTALSELSKERSAFQVDRVENRQEWTQRFQENTYDVALIHLDQLEELVERQAILPLPPSLSALQQRIHVDFRKMPHDPQGRLVLPLFWSAAGFLSTKKSISPPPPTGARSPIKTLTTKFTFKVKLLISYSSW